MTDFIDALERQLVAAHARPPRRFALPPWRATIVFAGAAAAAAVVVIAVVALSSPTQQPAAGSPPTTPPQTTPVHPPPALRVAVLNGTTTTGVARAVADVLTGLGYPEPAVVTTDTTNQTRQRTSIGYAPGHKDDAEDVAACLAVRLNRVAPMTPDERAVADRADVAIFVGADRVP
jgi:hypothetical protein